MVPLEKVKKSVKVQGWFVNADGVLRISCSAVTMNFVIPWRHIIGSQKKVRSATVIRGISIRILNDFLSRMLQIPKDNSTIMKYTKAAI